MGHVNDVITSTASNSALLPTDGRLTNATDGLKLEQIVYLSLYYSGLGILLLISICGNILVIVSIGSRDNLRVPTNCFLLSLAISDLIGSILYSIYQIGHIDMPQVISALGSWGQCTAIVAVVTGHQMISSYSLVAETAVRFIAVRYPIYYRQHISWRKVCTCVLVIWTAAFIIAMAMYLRVEAPGGYSGMCRYELWQGIGQISGMLLLSFLVPMVVMLALYSQIVVLLRRQAKRVLPMQQTSLATSDAPTNAKPRNTKNEMKLVATAAILLAYFIVSWVPFITYAYVAMLCSDCTISPYVRLLVRLLLYSNMSVNVFIYAGRSPSFRKAFRSALRRLFVCLR